MSFNLTNFCTSISNLTFNTSTGEINFTPDYFQSGDYEFKIFLTTGDGKTQTSLFTLIVNNVNRAPSLSAINNVKYQIKYNFPSVNADDGGDDQDIDLENITYTCLYDTVVDANVSGGASTCSSISGLSFDTSTGVLSGAVQSANIYEVKITGTDPLSLSSSQIFTLEGFISDLGTFGGLPTSTGKSGNYLYSANCLGLEVFNITTPATPVFTSAVETLGCSYDIAVDGNYAYITLQDMGLVIFDITNPLTPTIVSHFSSSYSLTLIKKSGNYLYVTSLGHGMLIIDVTTPTAPSQIGAIDLTGEFTVYGPSGIDVSGNTAYIVSNIYGIGSIDITNKAAPLFLNKDTFFSNYSVSILGTNILLGGDDSFVSMDMINPAVFTQRNDILTSPHNNNYLVNNGTNAFAGSTGDLKVFDITNLDSLSVVTTHSADCINTPLIIDGSNVFCTEGASGIKVMDVLTPATPSLTSTYDDRITYDANNLEISGTNIFMGSNASGNRKLYTVDASTLSSLTKSGSLPLSATSISDMYLDTNTLHLGYVGNPDYEIIDVTTPSAPVPLGTYNSGGTSVEQLKVVGNTAYLATGSDGLDILDITNPAAIVDLGGYNPGPPTCWQLKGVEVVGNTAYVSCWVADELQILDVTNPASVTLIGSVAIPTQSKVRISGTYVYLPLGTTGLQIIDVSTPATPVVTSTFNTAGSATDVAISGNYAYIADSSNGLVILDITNKATPALVSTYSLNENVYTVKISGNYAYLGTRSGIHILNITDPENPSKKQ